MVFAPGKEFDRLLMELQSTLNGLGYGDVYHVDLINAKKQTSARAAAAS